MAEYRMTYLDIKNYVEECADRSSNPELIRKHLPEILAAVTAKANDDQEISKVVLDDRVTLWRNQIGSPSEAVLGTKYFSIKSNIIELIGAMISSGIVDTVILNCLSGSECIFQGITMGAVSGVASTLIKILKSASNLEDHDFCVYMQGQHIFGNTKNLQKMISFNGSLISPMQHVICIIQNGTASIVQKMMSVKCCKMDIWTLRCHL